MNCWSKRCSHCCPQCTTWKCTYNSSCTMWCLQRSPGKAISQIYWGALTNYLFDLFIRFDSSYNLQLYIIYDILRWESRVFWCRPGWTWDEFLAVNVIDEGRKTNVLLALVGAETFKMVKNLCSPDGPKTKFYDDLKGLWENFTPKPVLITERETKVSTSPWLTLWYVWTSLFVCVCLEDFHMKPSQTDLCADFTRKCPKHKQICYQR